MYRQALRAAPRAVDPRCLGARHGRRSVAAPQRCPRAGSRTCATSGSAAAQETAAPAVPALQTEEQQQQYVQEMMAFLRADLPHLFDDQGIDASKYDEQVVFEDPITRYSSLQGYLFNIQFLRRVFSPSFVLHDLRQTGPLEVTTRWTMTMTLAFNRFNPLRALWDPTLTFTGTSIMGINPQTGRFNRHADTWDAVDNQAYFSLEAFLHLLSQVADPKRTPRGLESPPATVLIKRARYEVRRYDPYVVIEAGGATDGTDGAIAASSSGGSGDAGSGSGPGGRRGEGTAFMQLAGYLFGKNEAGQKLEMTTPVLTRPTGRMQFYVGGGVQDPAALPRPSSPAVAARQVPGGAYAVAAFPGLAGEAEVQRQLAELRTVLEGDGVRYHPDDWVLARYNEPGVLPPFRRNEVLLRLADPFHLPW